MSTAEKVATILGLAFITGVALAVDMEWTREVWTSFGLFCGVSGLTALSGVKLSIARRK